MADGACTFSDASKCTAVVCDVDNLNTDDDVGAGCEAGCRSAAYGTCTGCSAASTRTAATSDTDDFDTDGYAINWATRALAAKQAAAAPTAPALRS